MFFALSKVVFFVIQPSTVITLLLGVGIVLMARGRRPRAGRWLALGGLVLLLAGGFTPLANLAVAPLESRFAPAHLPASGEPPLAGIIILGGFEDFAHDGTGDFGVNEAADRLIEGLRLAAAMPGVKVVFSGGAGGVLLPATPAAGKVERFLRDVGIDAARIVIEGQSRNTHENALLTREILKPKAGERFLLVTSAWHMPRSMGVFRAAGFDVVPWPVDRRIKSPDDLWRPFDQVTEGLRRLDLGAKEWIGLVAYYVTGRTNALWPAP